MRKRTIYAYDENGNSVGEFESMTEAANETGTNQPAIHRCLKNKSYKAGGLYWRGGELYIMKGEDVVDRFESIEDASEEIGMSVKDIVRLALKGEEIDYLIGGEEETVVFEILPSPKTIDVPKVIVHQYDADGQYLATFGDSNEAADELGIDKIYINKSIKSKSSCRSTTEFDEEGKALRYYFSHDRKQKLKIPQKPDKYKIISGSKQMKFKRMSDIADMLGVTTQAVQRAISNGGTCSGYFIEKIKKSEN